ncbi:hypothetical protein GALMADRAFT_153731 [Galerina marginata CBS 339.88]|uniref:Uncharacterized protein n=1 Tax=Galerina marginata (strain CBS 339.88) TaxID=685588 RepID=A0A067TCF8_GALM3|nr:hypothetical protein GALMADRAFT_153731 [Galerina marginata CBS 339.88]
MSTSLPSLVDNTPPAVEAPLEDKSLNFKSFVTKCLHHAKNGAVYILPLFITFAKAFLWVLLFGQTHLNCIAVENLGVVGSNVIETEVLLDLIQDAKCKIKMSAFSLGLAFTLMQVISSGSWSSLGPFLYASIMLVFMSIVLHSTASSCYGVILQNPEGAARWFSHAQAMTGTSFALDPWIALSIPSAWSFWSFVFFFIVTFMTATNNPPSTSVGADVLRASHVKSVITSIFIIGTLGLKSCLLILITWRPYMINRRQDIE